jgi:hypothetical protein
MDDVDRSMYLRIKRIASRFVRRRLNPTLNATAVANEVWIRLKKSNSTLQVRDDSHFDALVGQAAGYVASDSARRRLAQKRDGGVLSDAGLDRQAARQASIDTILQVGSGPDRSRSPGCQDCGDPSRRGSTRAQPAASKRRRF